MKSKYQVCTVSDHVSLNIIIYIYFWNKRFTFYLHCYVKYSRSLYLIPVHVDMPLYTLQKKKTP